MKRTPLEPAVRERAIDRPEAGVGLAEVLISLVIFSTAILGIIGTAARVGAIVNSSHGRLTAGAVARQQIEQLLSEPYDSLKSGSSEQADVDLAWTVTPTNRAKQIVLVYQFDVPTGSGQDTLHAALLKP